MRIGLDERNCWIIRSRRTLPCGRIDVMYYETPAVWNRLPALATIFRSYEAADAHLNMYHHRDAAPKGWADGSIEVMDVVPLLGALRERQRG